MELNFTLAEIGNAARELIAETGRERVFAIHGDMGAGKTTFVSALCSCLGVREGVASPTFPIINEYETEEGGTIYHIDLYRLSGAGEARQAGVEEAIRSGYTCFVEWPERAPSLFPEDTIHLFFEVINETTRRVTIGD